MSWDWQFLVVSAAALWGLWILLRPFLPRRKEAAGGCPNCAASSSCSSAPVRGEGARLVTLSSKRPPAGAQASDAVLKIKN